MQNYLGCGHNVPTSITEDLRDQSRNRSVYQEDLHTLKIQMKPDAVEVYLQSIKTDTKPTKE